MIEKIGFFLLLLWIMSPLLYRMWAWHGVFMFVYSGFRWRALLAVSELVRLFEREDTVVIEESEESESTEVPLHIADRFGWH